MSFDEEARQSAEALAAQLGQQIQDRLQELVSALASAAAVERQGLIDQAQQAVSATERTLEAAVAQAREEAAADAATEAAAKFDAVQAERDAAQAQRDAEAAERAAAERRLDEAVSRAREEAIQETTARFEAEAAERAAAAERDAAADRDAATARDAAQQAAQDAAARHDRAREAMLAAMERLVAAFRRLDDGQSLSQLLDVLAEEAARETPRCAVFVVRGRTLQGWAFSGFADGPADARGLSLPLEASPELTRVVERGIRADVRGAGSLIDVDETPAAAFMELRPADLGVAVPVIVGGQVAALVYADDRAADHAGDDRPVSAGWPDAIELLARHAARCLEAQTAIRAARLANGTTQSAQAVRSAVGAAATAVVSSTADPAYAEEHARRYARLLLADLRLKNEAAVRTGREQRDLWRRLQTEIGNTREAFNERIAASLLHRDRIFEEELVRTLADGDETLFGFDTYGPPSSPAERLAV